LVKKITAQKYKPETGGNLGYSNSFFVEIFNGDFTFSADMDNIWLYKSFNQTDGELYHYFHEYFKYNTLWNISWFVARYLLNP